VKLCGMTRAEDVAHAAALGVDAIGMIFHPKSPRNVTISQASTMLQNAPPFLTVVAVLVDPSVAFVEKILQALPVSCLQFHGSESASFCEQFYVPYIKAIAATSQDEIEQVAAMHAHATAILLDTPADGMRGGSGQTFDWSIIPQKINKPLVLAGGLHASNINDAISVCSPDAIDICSGVEASPGIKSLEKITQLLSVLERREI